MDQLNAQIGPDASLLLVDDDEIFVTRLARAMEKRGFQPETSLTVAGAMRLIERRAPAYAVVDGWLLAASNLGALQRLVQASAAKRADAPAPAWAAAANRPAAAALWLDLARSGKVARDAIATWSMAQMFSNGSDSQAIRERLNEAKTWIDAFAPLGTARADLGRRDGTTALSLDLGLSGAAAAE